MRHLTLMLVTIFSLSCAFAKNLQPVENVGRVVVRLPDVSQFPKSVQEEYQKAFPRLYFRDQEIKANNEYFVDAGEGCVQVSVIASGNNSIKAEGTCGTVKPGQLTELQLQAVHFKLDNAHLKTEIGPTAVIQFMTPAGAYHYTEADNTQFLNTHLFISGRGTFKVTALISGTPFTIDEKTVNISTSQTVPFSPKDIREDITFEFRNGPAKFSHTDVSLFFRSQPFTYTDMSLISLPYGKVINYIQLSPSQTSKKIKFFPFDQFAKPELSLWTLEAITNETRWPLSFAKNLKQVVPIEIINVNNYQTGKSGIFTFDRKDTLDDKTQKWSPIYTKFNNSGAFYPDRYLLTPTTLLLFPGNEYKFEFFIRDDLGKLFKQDEILLDLK